MVMRSKYLNLFPKISTEHVGQGLRSLVFAGPICIADLAAVFLKFCSFPFGEKESPALCPEAQNPVPLPPMPKAGT